MFTMKRVSLGSIGIMMTRILYLPRFKVSACEPLLRILQNLATKELASESI